MIQYVLNIFKTYLKSIYALVWSQKKKILKLKFPIFRFFQLDDMSSKKENDNMKILLIINQYYKIY